MIGSRMSSYAFKLSASIDVKASCESIAEAHRMRRTESPLVKGLSFVRQPERNKRKSKLSRLRVTQTEPAVIYTVTEKVLDVSQLSPLPERQPGKREACGARSS